MGKGHSQSKKRIVGKGKGKKLLPEQVRNITQTIRTAGDLDKVLTKNNIEKQDIEEILEKNYGDLLYTTIPTKNKKKRKKVEEEEVEEEEEKEKKKGKKKRKKGK